VNNNPQITISSDLEYALEKLIALHRSLVDLLAEEYAHMGAVDIKGLAEAAQTKEVLLSEIMTHEELRLTAALDLAKKVGASPESAQSLAILTKHLSDSDAHRVRQLGTVLTMLVTQAKEANIKNMSFVEASLERIEQMKKNVLGLNNNAPKENYANTGLRQPVTEQGGRLLSTEA
jgi:flagellar biosynthesis/type III secretory pathway chaperone